MDLDVALFHESDVDEVLDLIHHTMLLSNVKDYGLDVVKRDMARFDETFIIERARFTHFYVFRDHGKVIATGAIGPYWDSVDECCLFTIFVHPDYQGRGVGRNVVEMLEADDYFLASKRVELSSSLTAVSFYKHLGYHCMDDTCTPNERGVVRMEKFRRKVEVVPYDNDWPNQFDNVRSDLLDVFGDEALAIEHIGSTSVPGLSAKPTIDVLVTVKNITYVDGLNDAMAAIGLVAKGENGIAGRRYFSMQNGTKHLVHVHVYDVSYQDEITRHLAFRDYLIAHPNVMHDYRDLKLKLARNFPYQIDRYIEGKYDFIVHVEQAALKWYASNF